MAVPWRAGNRSGVVCAWRGGAVGEGRNGGRRQGTTHNTGSIYPLSSLALSSFFPLSLYPLSFLSDITFWLYALPSLTLSTSSLLGYIHLFSLWLYPHSSLSGSVPLLQSCMAGVPWHMRRMSHKFARPEVAGNKLAKQILCVQRV